MQKKFKVIRVPIPTPTLYPHTTTNCYLIGNNHECILVDAGYDMEDTKTILEKNIAEHQLATPKRIILTHAHPDHAPGVKQLMDWSPEIFCHAEEKQGILTSISPLENISFLSDGETIHIAGEEIRIIHGPGHTAGHLSLYLPFVQILIAGDNIVAEGTTWIGAPDGDMKDYMQTLHRLRKLKLSKIGPGHGDWVINPYEHIQFVIERRIQRETQIKSLLEEHQSLTSTRLTKLIYQDTIHPSVFEVARRTTEAHLGKLVKEGVVTAKEGFFSNVS